MSATLFDQAAEEAVLGAVLANTSAVGVAVRMLSFEDFYVIDHGRVFAVVAALHEHGTPVDTVTLAARLKGRKWFSDRSGRDWLVTLADACPAATNVTHYAGIVADLAQKRREAVAWHTYQEALASGNGSDAVTRETLCHVLAAAPPSTPGSARVVCVDWSTFWDRDHDEAEWVYPDVLARGRGHALYAVHKTGKSLFMLWIAAQLATGSDPIVVVYLDYENTKADIFDRLEDMGHGPDSDLSRLRYALLPALPALDTAEGAVALMGLVDGAQGEQPDHHLVVIIDTIGRAVRGEENSADTFRDFYGHTGIELKRRGITWARLDHGGKDPEKGPRGSSGKGDDVDLVWKLAATNSGVSLRRDFSRMPWVPPNVTFGLFENPLRYTRLAGDWPAGTGETANLLERLEVPLDASTRTALARLKEVDEGRRRQVVIAALRWRRERLEGES